MWKGRAQSELVLRPFFIITIILQMRGKDMYYKLMKDVLFVDIVFVCQCEEKCILVQDGKQI